MNVLYALNGLLAGHNKTLSLQRLLDRAEWDDLPTLQAVLDVASRECHCLFQHDKVSARALHAVPFSQFPVLAHLQGGEWVILESLGEQDVALARLDGAEKRHEVLAWGEFRQLYQGELIRLVPETQVRDRRIADLLKPTGRSWFRRMLMQHRGSYKAIAMATFVGNFLAISSALFAMQVWDRVLPAQATNTLWVLALGVFVALGLDFALRNLRAALADSVGKQIGLDIANLSFTRMLDIKPDEKPASSGTMIAQLREIDGVRDTLTSTSVLALMDIPFVLVFFGVIWFVGGELVYVVALAIPLLVIPGLIAQWPLAHYANQNLKERSIRNAMLIEAVEHSEDIKLLQAESRFVALWERINRVSAHSDNHQKRVTNALMAWSNFVQQGVYTLVLVAGVYQILAGNLTQGSVLACTILTGRAIAPIGSVASIFMRLQNARLARKSLNDLFAKGVDHDPEVPKVRRGQLRGQFELSQVQAGYGEDEKVALAVASLVIKPGEKIAILGRTGAGKSTLLRLLSGMQAARQGDILLDGAPIGTLEADDLRRHLAYLPQGSSLFFGTVRENLLLSNPRATDEQLLRTLALAGAESLVQGHPAGLDRMLREGGAGLSGGQKQQLMLARTLLREPDILLLDEPTAAMDDTTERTVITRLTPWLAKRTLIIATHRPMSLALVDRIVVVEQNKIVLDGPKDDVLARLQAPTQMAANANKNPQGAQP